MKDGFWRLYLIIATILLGVVLLGFLFRADLGYAYFFGNPRDTFMDYFNSISKASLITSYKSSNIYPPLCWVIFDVCRLLSGDTKAIIESGDGSVFTLKYYQAPMMIWTIMLMICILLIYSLISEMWNYESPLKQWGIILLMLSVPFLFTVERGNIILLSFIGTLAFFAMKDSEKKWVREAGYLCLAFAAAIKIYPAIFGFVLVKEKRYKEALRLAIYGIIVFVIPFLFFCEEGISGIFYFFGNLLGWSSAYMNSVTKQVALGSGLTRNIAKEILDPNVIDGSRIGFAAFMEHLFMWFGLSAGAAIRAAAKLGTCLSAIAFVTAFFSKKKWQFVLLLACVLVGFQSRSYVYTAIFLIIPFIFFLREEKRSAWNVVYFSLLMLILFPLPFGWTEHLHEWGYYINHRSFNDLQIGGAIFGVTIASIIDIIFSQVMTKMNKKI